MENAPLSKILVLFLIVFYLGTSCKKKEVPVVETTSVTNILGTTALSGGIIIDDRDETITSRGVCWSKDVNPSVSNDKTLDGAGAGTFVSNMEDLDPASTYYVRAYAANANGIGYGMTMSFSTLGQIPEGGTITASQITSNSVSLVSIINPNYLSTSIIFEYGPTINYGNSLPANQNPITGNTGLIVSGTISGLSPGTTYHCRVKAENALGIKLGEDITFRTLGQLPTVTTQPASAIHATTVNLKGLVNANYLSTIVSFDYGTTISYGSTISASPNPITGSTLISVSALLTNLSEGETYHYRLKATNSIGTTFGSDVTFIPSGANPVTDVDGNVYSVVEIGTQIWMEENLKTTKYNDNTDITPITNNSTWISLSTPAFCWYNNDESSYKSTYGALYNWYAVNTGKLCPIGWHVPSDAEFTTLTNYLGDITLAGGKIKEAGTVHWTAPNTGATNTSGFTALPAGYRTDSGGFEGVNLYGIWWTSTPYNIIKPWYRSVGYQTAGINIGNGSLNQRGFSIRCVKD